MFQLLQVIRNFNKRREAKKLKKAKDRRWKQFFKSSMV